MLSFSGERTSWQLFRKQLRSSCDQNGMGWAITVGHAMNQFLIHMAANNAAAAAAAKKDIPANFEDFEVADGLVLEGMIERSGALLTCKLAMIKSRTSSLGTNFSDYTKMRLASEQDLDDLIEATDKEYLIQVNRWLVRTIHGAIYPDGHTATTATNKLIHIVESPNIQKILNGESIGTEDTWSMEELWRLPGIAMYAKLAYKYEGFVDVLNGTFIEEISELLLSATTTGAKGKTIFEVDNAMEILAENIEKNFNDVPTFLKFMRASMRQAMIRRLAKHSTNKAAWSKAEDFIQDLLQTNTALTLETTQMAIDRAQTYMSREEKLHTSTTLVASTSTDAEIEILKAELASLKAGAVAAAGRGTGRGKQGGAQKGGGRNHAAVGRGRSTETCTKCGKVGHVTAQCFQTGDELAAKAEAMAKEAAAILAKRKTSRKPNDAEVKAYSAGCVANKDDEEYVSRAAAVLPVHASPSTKLISPSSIVIYHGHLSPTQITAKKYDTSVACSAILDQKFVPDTIIDSAVMMNVVENTSRQELAGGKRVNILGVTGDTASAQVADVVFSIKTKAKKPYVLATKGTTLVLDKTKDNILSLAVLLQSGFKVDFAIGTVDDPSFGGVLTTPTGARATLLFENNLWRIPMAFLPTMTASTSQAHISNEHNIQASPITISGISSKITAGAHMRL